MPLLDSFKVDHTKMQAPAVRLAKSMHSAKGEPISVYDLRFTRPNQKMLSILGIHTLEHLFANFMRVHLNGTACEIIDLSPMGCRTGFYMSILGNPSESQVIEAWMAAMKDVLKVEKQEDIPELNVYQCGSYKMHSLDDAKKIAQEVIDQGIGVNDNQALALSDEQLRELGNSI